MRMIAAFALTTAIAVAYANASSIIAVGGNEEAIGPSTIIFGGTTGAALVETQQVDIGSTVDLSSVISDSPSVKMVVQPAGTPTPSVVILGEPGGSVVEDKISEVVNPVANQSGMAMMPMIIRGGIVGDAFARPVPASASQTGPTTMPTLDPNDKGTASKRKALKRQAERQRAMAQEAPQEAPAPMPHTE